MGTADYLPPEQILNPGTITPAGDIYSLGCTLYYAVTGKVPYPGGVPREKAHRHCNDTPLHPRHFNPSLSDDFLAVLAGMMQKDPNKRIASAEQVVRRLAPWAGNSVPAPTEPDQTAGIPRARFRSNLQWREKGQTRRPASPIWRRCFPTKRKARANTRRAPSR